MDAEELLSKANIRLKALGLGVTLELRGTKIYIRATFPPKLGSKKIRPYRQRLSLDLTATRPGIKMAEREAVRIGEQLSSNTFSWITIEKYQVNKDFTVEECLRIAEKKYFETRQKDNKSISTWETNYKIIWNQIGKSEVVTKGLVREFILGRNIGIHRNRAITVCKHICKAVGLEISVDDLVSKNWKKVDRTTSAPSDEEIVFYYQQMVKWSEEITRYIPIRSCHVWVYGMMATYGLRPHETRSVQWNKDNTINVLEHKTDKYHGPRHNIYPFPPDWVKQFKLRDGDIELIDVKRDDYKLINHYTRKIWYAFRFAKIPFKPYMLRHAYAIRLMSHRVEINISAGLMGHSPGTHINVYRQSYNDKVKAKMMKEAYSSFNQNQ